MKLTLYSFAVFIFFGCTSSIGNEDLKHLNGYWEISKVTFPNGETKDFTVNPTVDFIALKGLEGYRKKVYPKFDGTYETSADADNFNIVEEGDTFQIQYLANIALKPEKQRKETLLKLSVNSFSVINKDTMTYTYTRFQPINATE